MILLKNRQDWKIHATALGLSTEPLRYPVVVAALHEFVYRQAFTVIPEYQWFVLLDGQKLRVSHKKYKETLIQNNTPLSSTVDRYDVLIEEGTLKGQTVRVPSSRLIMENA